MLSRLGLRDEELRGLTVYKRSYDARKRGAILLIYSLDLDVLDADAVLKSAAGDGRLGPRPDTSYQFVAEAPPGLAMRPVVIGMAIGQAGAAAVSTVLGSMLFGLSPHDPTSFLLAPAMLLAIALFACYVPARRALRVEPTTALRTE